MPESNYKKYIKFLKKVLRALRPRFSFHYVAYTAMTVLVVFSVIQIAKATTPNPGHPWSELGDGVFVFSSGQTVTPYTYTFPAANATVLTTNDAVTLGQGGTGTALADPDADQCMMWDDSAGVMVWTDCATAETDPNSLHLDQSTPQTIINGAPYIPAINGGANANDDLTLQGTTNDTRTTSYVVLQPNGGNVGIGTNNPWAPLSVYSEDSSNTLGLQVSNNSEGDAAIAGVNFDAGGVSSAAFGAFGANYDGGTEYGNSLGHLAGRTGLLSISGDGLDFITVGDFRVYTGGASPSEERLRIDSSGNIGIGTDSPASKLYVMQTATGVNNYGIYGYAGGIGTNNYAGYFDAENATGTNFALYTNIGDVSLVSTSGNVGIGTGGAATTEKLEVVGNIYINNPGGYLKFNNGFKITDGTGVLTVTDSGGDTIMVFDEL